MMDEFYGSSVTQWQSYWTQASIDRRFATNDQRVLGGMDGQYYQNQKFVFPIIHSLRQMILGYQRRHRKSSIVVPVEDRYQDVADDYSGCLLWMMQMDNMLHKITDAFDTTLVTGMCLQHKWKDYSADPVDPITRIKNYSPTTCLMDPWWRDKTLKDCRFIWTRDFLSYKQIQRLIPEHEKILPSIPKSYNSSLRFTFMPESYQMQRKQKDNYAYDQFYYATDRPATLVHSFTRAETYEIKGDQETIDMWIDLEFSPDEKESIRITKTHVPCVNRAIAINDRVVYDEYFEDLYPFTVQLAYFDPDAVNYNYRFQGIVRPVRDIQYLFNRKMNINLQVLESLPTSGIYVTEDALLDKNDAFKTGPGQVTPIKKGLDPRSVIMPMQPPSIDPTALQMNDNLEGLSKSILGISDELMGMAEDSKTGIQEILRQGASLTTLQTLFDNLDISQSLLSHSLLSDIQEFSPSKVEKILGRPPTKDFYNISIAKFYVEIEDGLNTQTQKQMQFAQMLNLTREAGIQFSPNAWLKASTLQNKQELIEDAQQTQQMMAQDQQAKIEAEMQVAQANAQLLQSQAQYNHSKAAESLSKIDDNRALAEERRAKAVDEMDDATLRKLEGIKKLQELDLSQIGHLVEILQGLKKLNQPQEVQNGLYTQGREEYLQAGG
jgi:hypothetical protein